MKSSPTCLAAIVYTMLSMLTASSAVHGGCEADTPARPVPQFDPDLAPGVSLWPLHPDTGEVLLRPAKESPGVTRSHVSTLPAERDSTHYNGLSDPGVVLGDEIFQDVAAPGDGEADATQADWVIAFYNSGLSVWDLRTDPEKPRLAARKDGFPPPWGPYDWAVFPVSGEDSFPLRAGDVVQDGDLLYIAAAGRADTGFALWVFDTTTGLLEQRYQDPYGLDGLDVSLAKTPEGGIYAFMADNELNGGGVRVYDALAIPAGELCVEPMGSSDTCGVFRGRVGTIAASAHVDARVVDGTLYVAASDGLFNFGGPLKLEIWEVPDPQDPAPSPEGAAVRRFVGLSSHVHSPQLFTYEGAAYLALVETLGVGSHQMRIHDIGHCLDANGCTSLGAAKATETIRDSGANLQFLDLSFSNGSPYLHYGMEGNGLFGAGFEHLWSLGDLPSTTAPNGLPELTDSGGTYADPCDGEEVDYFGDYYPGNEFGLRSFSPRHAVFTGPYLYRAAESIFDIHVRGGPETPEGPSIIPRLQTGGSIDGDTFWLDDEVDLEADVFNCLAGGTNWCWQTVVGNPDVAAFPEPLNPDGCDPSFFDDHTLAFLCQGSGRCADTSVSVATWNSSASCADTAADPVTIDFHLKDPEVDATGLDAGGSSFPECQVVSLQGTAQGRGAVEWAWLVQGEPIPGCGGIVPAGRDLSAESFACTWNSGGVSFDLIFGDDFEDGTCAAWDFGCPAAFKTGVVRTPKTVRGGPAEKAGGTVNVEFEVRQVAGPVLDSVSQAITFVPAGEPSFLGPLPDPVVEGGSAILLAPATDTTTWTWEIENPDVSGSPCSFDSERNCDLEETSIGSLDYHWESGGTYTFEVSLSSCSFPEAVSAVGTATVDDSLAEIVHFGVSPASIRTVGQPDAPCCKPFPFDTIICPTETEIEFDVEVAEEGVFVFLFDWERTSSAEPPSYVPSMPSSVDGTEYLFTHTFPGSVPSPNFPISSVSFGNEMPLDDQLEFGSCD